MKTLEKNLFQTSNVQELKDTELSIIFGGGGGLSDLVVRGLTWLGDVLSNASSSSGGDPYRPGFGGIVGPKY